MIWGLLAAGAAGAALIEGAREVNKILIELRAKKALHIDAVQVGSAAAGGGADAIAQYLGFARPYTPAQLDAIKSEICRRWPSAMGCPTAPLTENPLPTPAIGPAQPLMVGEPVPGSYEPPVPGSEEPVVAPCFCDGGACDCH